MPISFTCPHCGHHTDVDDMYAGQSGPCVSCANTIFVPIAEPQTRAAAPAGLSASVKLGLVLGALASLSVLAATGVILLRPVVESATDAAQCTACQKNLRRIGRALEAYREAHGTYPPAVSSDSGGRALHSWRLLILPYLGASAEQLYELYDLTKPWNSQENLPLLSQMPEVYRCPADAAAILGEASYLAIVGRNTVIGSPRDLLAVSDPHSKTLVVVEAAGSKTNWLNPKDIGIDQLRIGLNSQIAASPGSQHAVGVNALMADGSVLTVPASATSASLRAAATIDGNEVVDFSSE